MKKAKNYQLKSELGIKTAKELSAIIETAGNSALTSDTFAYWLINDEKKLQRFLELACEGTIPQIDNLTYDELSELVVDFFDGSGKKLLSSINASRILSNKEMFQELVKNQTPKIMNG